MKMEKEKSSWTATLFRYAEGQKAKLVISVILSVISVTSGLVPFYCMYRIICLFTDGIASSSSIIGWCIGALAAYIVLYRKGSVVHAIHRHLPQYGIQCS